MGRLFENGKGDLDDGVGWFTDRIIGMVSEMWAKKHRGRRDRNGIYSLLRGVIKGLAIEL